MQKSSGKIIFLVLFCLKIFFDAKLRFALLSYFFYFASLRVKESYFDCMTRSFASCFKLPHLVPIFQIYDCVERSRSKKVDTRKYFKHEKIPGRVSLFICSCVLRSIRICSSLPRKFTTTNDVTEWFSYYKSLILIFSSMKSTQNLTLWMIPSQKSLQGTMPA